MEDSSPLWDVMMATIPEEEIARLRAQPLGQINEGNNYIAQWPDISPIPEHNILCSYNNTRPSEKEILEWIDRALLLAESESFQNPATETAD